MKLAITTWYHYRNYGTALQVTALTSVLRSLGHEPQVISYKPCGYFRTVPDYSISAFGKRIYRKFFNHTVITDEVHFCDEQKDELFETFLNTHIRFTEVCTTKADLERLNDEFDAFICGSDQIWTPLAFDPKYYLDYVHSSAKKIAYAPSFGVEKIKDPYIRVEIAKLLECFCSLSVREKAGKQIIKELSHKDAQLVLDPTLLLTAQQWKNQFELCKQTQESPYLLAYMLGNNAEHWTAIRETAVHMGLNLRIIPVFESDLSRTGCISELIGPKEFLELVSGASYVCTDSFHGMIFSILFHRPFSAFVRFNKNDIRNQNSRIFNLLSMLKMQDRLIVGNNEKTVAEALVDFSNADYILDEMRSDSVNYLLEALSKASKAEEKEAAVMKQNSLCCGCGACKSVCPISAISIVQSEEGFRQAKVDENKCIHCGKCKAVCPFCTKNGCISAKDASLYSYKSIDPAVLLHSTSGGAAYDIAKILLKEGFCIAGCQYDTERQQAKHVIVESEEELPALQGSKYIQSNFTEVLENLKSCSKPVAVFGTPCQISAARKVLNGRTGDIFIDLVCHGVPSAYLFEKYREHIHEVSNVDTSQMKMSFRYKPKGWSDIHLYASDGEHEYCACKAEDPFFRMFEHGVCYNETCYECRWRVDSEADIRLGDYWGPRFKLDPTGVSMVLCFTRVGYDIVEKLRLAETGYIEEQPIADYLKYQQSKNLPKPVFYDVLIANLKSPKYKLTNIAEKYVTPFENKSFSRAGYLKYVLNMLRYGK